MLKATARALARARFEPIDPDALLGLEPLGLRATGQRVIEPADGRCELVVEARPVLDIVDERLFCASCGAQGRRAGTVARLHWPTPRPAGGSPACWCESPGSPASTASACGASTWPRRRGLEAR